LNLELQTREDADMTHRMLAYYVELYGKYHLPVISMVMYPFETTIAEPRFREGSEDDTLLLFQHQILRLWTLDAKQYLNRSVVGIYTLLPAMKGANAMMLIQAIEEMEKQYQGIYLARHLVRFRTILRRSTTLSKQDKQIVEERMHIYDSLLDEDPDIRDVVQGQEMKESWQSSGRW